MKKKETTNKKETGNISRRQFIQGAGIVGGAAIVSGLAACSPATSTITSTLTGTTTVTAPPVTTTITATPWLPAKWDYSADLVIIGTGDAGYSAAITAIDAGSSVLVLEKLSQQFEGGSSRVAANYICAYYNGTTGQPDVASGTAYLRALAAGTVEDDSIFAAQAQGYNDNLTVIQAMGGQFGTLPGTASVPAAPGASAYHQFVIATPGAPASTVVAGFTVGASGDYKLWQFYKDQAVKRNVNVMYETPATELIQNANTKEILGIYATNNGAKIAIKANKAVILACGSIEFAPDLQKQYWPASPVYSTGTPGDTGDGIRMAQKVGADLWHMNYGFGTYGAFIPPGGKPMINGVYPVSARGISVNKMGNRFNNNNSINGPLGGFANELGVNLAYDITTVDWNSVPCWCIFDDTARLKGPIMSTSLVASTGPGVAGKSGWFSLVDNNWSKDNMDEVNKGWILKGNSLADLAAQIANDSDNNGKMSPTGLQATVDAWNVDCTNKTDAQFFTNPTGLVPLSGPPYYAMKLWPNYVNPSAGPRRSKLCEVLNPDKQPIPRLYSAGELGAFWGWLQSSGSHLAEALWTGRVAGTNAAALTSWV